MFRLGLSLSIMRNLEIINDELILPFKKSDKKNKFMNQRDLKEYIVKLNDRNIQRQRETGFTLYAIIGSIVFCVFYLIDNIEIAFSICTKTNFLNFAAFMANAVFIFSFFYFSYGSATRRQTLTKIFPYKTPLSLSIGDFPLIISYLSISIINFCLIGQSQNNWHKYFFGIFGFLTLLNCLLPYGIMLYGSYSRSQKKKKGHSIEEFDFTFFNKGLISAISKGFLFYAIVLSLFWLWVVHMVEFAIKPNDIGSISKYVILYFALFYLIMKAMDIKSKEHNNNQLEDFEKEIFFENISNEDIAKKYEKDFDGIPFSKWITEKQLEIANFYDLKRSDFVKQAILLQDVDNVDVKQFPYEVSGRLQDVVKNQINLLNETNDFVQRISVAFNNLKNFSSLNEEELDKLNFVQNFLNQSIMSFNRQYSNLSHQIQISQNRNIGIAPTQ